MSRPIVVIACMPGSSESWELQQHPHLWHSRAGGGAVHSIISGLMRRRNFSSISMVSPVPARCRAPHAMKIELSASTTATPRMPLPFKRRIRAPRNRGGILRIEGIERSSLFQGRLHQADGELHLFIYITGHRVGQHVDRPDEAAAFLAVR